MLWNTANPIVFWVSCFFTIPAFYQRRDFRFATTSIELQAVNLTNACKLAGEAELRYIKSDAKMSRSKMALLDTTI